MMTKAIAIILSMLLGSAAHSQAATNQTGRSPEFSNARVSVWKTVIYPTQGQLLSKHRHDHDRVVVALSDGILKVTNDKGKQHLLKLVKDKAYYLTKDKPGELHWDENISGKPISVMVIELKD